MATAASKAKAADKTVDPKDAMSKLQPMAKLLGQTAGQIWKIFVLRYVAKGVAELFSAGVITWLAFDKLWTHHFGWFCLPFAVALLLTFDAIQLLINPYYFAMDDVEKVIKRNTQKTNEITVYNNR